MSNDQAIVAVIKRDPALLAFLNAQADRLGAAAALGRVDGDFPIPEQVIERAAKEGDRAKNW